MRLGSLCSGYGGLDLAVEEHYGATMAWHAETDKDCSKVLAHHWPAVPNHGDLTAVDWGQVAPVDVLAAGYPCQPYSTAGKRDPNDERAIFAYIADGISVLRPGIVVLENVAGHLSMGAAGVVGTLAGLGYVGRAGVVSAAEAGAPHRRRRWWCIATAARNADEGQRGEVGSVQKEEPEHGGTGRDAATDTEGAERRGAEHETVDTATRRTAEPGECPGPTAWDRYEPAIRRWERILGRPAPDPVTDGRLEPAFVEWLMGLPKGWVCDVDLSRNAKLKMLGNGVCLPQARLALRLLAEMESG